MAENKDKFVDNSKSSVEKIYINELNKDQVVLVQHPNLPKNFNWEFSISGTFGSFSQTVKYQGHESKSVGTDYLLLVLRPGYYFYDSMEFEPEILITAIENLKPGYCFNGNIVYNLVMPETNVVPFFLAGVGFGNSLPRFDVAIKESDKMDVINFNLGVGAKIFLSNSIALRTEYRFQQFSYHREMLVGNGEYSYKYNLIKLLFGFSFFL